jgi:N-acyl-L-homoserine lactone synthetase
MGAPQVRVSLPFGERLAQAVQKVEYRRAETAEQREAIFQLRYRAYLREGAIEPSFGRRYSDRYDDADNAWLVGLHVDGRLVSSFRLHVGTPDYPDIPATQVFKEYVDTEIGAGKIIIDPTRFVVDHQAAAMSPELPYLTVRVGHMAAEYFGADIVLATVRAEHQAFYKRVFGHQAICEPKPYPGLIKPISLMTLDYPAQRSNILRRYPFFASTVDEQTALFGAFPWTGRTIIPAPAPLAV